MRLLLSGLFVLAALASQAQTAELSASNGPAPTITKMVSQPDAVKKLRKLKGAIPKRVADVTFRNQAKISQIMGASTDEFIKIAGSEPSEEAYLKSIDTSLTQLVPLTRSPDDREEVAKYYQELMDAVQLPTSGGRLNDFVTRPKTKKADLPN